MSEQNVKRLFGDDGRELSKEAHAAAWIGAYQTRNPGYVPSVRQVVMGVKRDYNLSIAVPTAHEALKTKKPPG